MPTGFDGVEVMRHKLIIYPDTCFYCRPFDNQRQAKIRNETVAIMDIVNNRDVMGYLIVGSFTVLLELRKIKSSQKRRAVEKFYLDTVETEIRLTSSALAEAQKIRAATKMGIADSRHLIAAEMIGADFLLTTDQDFIAKSNCLKLIHVKVINPIDF